MENRIDLKFRELKKDNKKALITFITAGYPDIDTCTELVLSMEKDGADIIELGIPYSDPMADGVIIQESSLLALKNGARIYKIMDMVRKIRAKSQIPLVYMLYYNCIFKYGMEKFFSESKESGIDGFIIPDLPIEERLDTIDMAGKYGIELIPLVAPTSSERIKKITENAEGFVYCVSTTGVTGVRQSLNTNIEEYIKIVSSYTDKPKAIGFGISNVDTVKEISPIVMEL
jgi:tryptophan synthase alpha chain